MNKNEQKAKNQLSGELASLRLYVENIKERNNFLFDRNLAFSVIIGLDGKIENVNKAFLEELGYRKHEVVNNSLIKFIIPDKRKAFLSQFEKGFEGGETVDLEVGIYAKDGSVKTVLFSSSQLLFQEEGKPHCILVSGVDITARKKAENDLKALHKELSSEEQKLEQVLNIDQRISSILELHHLIDFIIEKVVQILDAQRCSLMVLDDDSRELIIKGAKGLEEHVVSHTRVKLGESIAGVVAKDGNPMVVANIETEPGIARKSRASYKSKSFLSLPIKLHNKTIGVLNVNDKGPQGEDIFTQKDSKILAMIIQQAAIAIENANYCRELEYLSTKDSLTGIYNHRYFMQTLKQEVDRSFRYNRPACLLMFDIDDFKSYNDVHGHLEGDKVLKKIAMMVSRSLREVDIFCRYAGDEFVIILPETSILQAKVIAEKIRKAVSNLKLKRVITISMGISAHHKNLDGRDFILKSDQALYQAKKEGKNGICCLP